MHLYLLQKTHNVHLDIINVTKCGINRSTLAYVYKITKEPYLKIHEAKAQMTRQDAINY